MVSKRRIPRKSKKWHKKNGYTTHYLDNGTVYFTKEYSWFSVEFLSEIF